MSQFHTLRHNGFTSILNKTQNEICNLKICVQAGSQDEQRPDQFGVAHFLEHMCFKGTKSFDATAFKKRAARIGEIGAYTSTRFTVYEISFLKNKLKEAFQHLCELVFVPRIPEDEFQKEKGVILEELSTYDSNPHAFFHYRYIESLLGTQIGHPILGNKNSIAEMTRENILELIDSYYSPNNMAIGVTGNIEPSDLEKCLVLLPERKDKQIKKRPNLVLNLDAFNCEHKTEQSAIAIIYKGITYREDFERNGITDVFNNGFGQGLHSLLFEYIREKLGVCYSIRSNASDFSNYGTQSISVNLSKENISLTMEAIDKLIEQVKANGFSPEQLEISKENVLFRVFSYVETSQGNGRVFDDYFELNGVPIDQASDPKVFQKNIAKLTNDDIVKYANETFDSHKPRKICTMNG